MMRRWRWPLGLLLLLLLGAVLALASAARPSQPAPVASAAAIVLISGRDDHGLLAEPQVALKRAPDDSTEVARVADGTFARVLGQRGEWFQVQTLKTPPTTGWLNDYYLRDRALRRDGKGQVTFVEAHLEDDDLMLAVRPVDEPDARPVWVPATVLVEVGAQEDGEGGDSHHH
jgi:hypothetical protein